MNQYVYFALDSTRQQVKIGLSVSPQMRIKSLPAGLRLVAVIPGSRSVERDIHSRFAKYRVIGRVGSGKTEWFAYSQEVATFAKSYSLPLEDFAPPSIYNLVLPADLHRELRIASANTGTPICELILTAIEAEYPEAA